MNYDVTVKTIPERYAATVHMVVPRYEDEGMAWGMMAECKVPLIPADPCLAAAEFLDKEYKEENVEIMVWMTVKGTYEDTEHVKFRVLPAVKVASCVIRGSYDQMGDATATVVSWINENGYEVTGPMFTTSVLIFIGTTLTGLGVYDRIGKYAGAGSAIPVTGFANSVAAPAIEFQREGAITGVGARLFTLAGPVLAYGIASSVAVGAVYWLLRRWVG